MHRWTAIAFLGFALAAGCRFSQEPRPDTNRITVFPAEDTNAVLHNPDMGWVLYENYPLDQDANGSSTMLTLPADDFPEVDAVALMFSWRDVETERDNFDFSKADQAYDYWKKRRKEIQLRLSSESLMVPTRGNPLSGSGVPAYVLEHLDAKEKQVRKMDGTPYTVVDVGSPGTELEFAL